MTASPTSSPSTRPATCARTSATRPVTRTPPSPAPSRTASPSPRVLDRRRHREVLAHRPLHRLPGCPTASTYTQAPARASSMSVAVWRCCRRPARPIRRLQADGPQRGHRRWRFPGHVRPHRRRLLGVLRVHRIQLHRTEEAGRRRLGGPRRHGCPRRRCPTSCSATPPTRTAASSCERASRERTAESTWPRSPPPRAAGLHLRHHRLEQGGTAHDPRYPDVNGDGIPDVWAVDANGNQYLLKGGTARLGAVTGVDEDALKTFLTIG